MVLFSSSFRVDLIAHKLLSHSLPCLVLRFICYMFYLYVLSVTSGPKWRALGKPSEEEMKFSSNVSRRSPEIGDHKNLELVGGPPTLNSL